jgi:hypothetical protein
LLQNPETVQPGHTDRSRSEPRGVFCGWLLLPDGRARSGFWTWLDTAARDVGGAATRVAWLADETDEANAERLLGAIMRASMTGIG